MAWLPRTIEDRLRNGENGLELFPVWSIIGPRQVGKSSLLRRIAEPNRQIFTLDDTETRLRVEADPILFARELRPPLLIDEVQYAPVVLPLIKRLVDSSKETGTDFPGMVWLTGSQSFEVIRGAQESLAGRIAMIDLYGLSDEEEGISSSPPDVFDSILASSFPALHGIQNPVARQLYLENYVSTYIERDVTQLSQIRRTREFETFIRLMALRTGQEIEPAKVGQEAGVSATTASEWLSILEGARLVRRVHPWHSSLNSRLVKKSKYVWLDGGLAAYLAGWREPDMARLGPMGGSLFESHVVGQIVRFFAHRILPFQLHFFRTRDGKEIDLLLERSSRIWPIEIKMGIPDTRSLIKLESVRENNWERGTIVSLASSAKTPRPHTSDWDILGFADLTDWLKAITNL